MVFGPNEIGSNKMSCFGFLANLMPPLHRPSSRIACSVFGLGWGDWPDRYFVPGEVRNYCTIGACRPSGLLPHNRHPHFQLVECLVVHLTLPSHVLGNQYAGVHAFDLEALVLPAARVRREYGS
jgi:hypothetical protein